MPQAQRPAEPLWLAAGLLLTLILSGAILSQLLLSRLHDRQLAPLGAL
ncbi:MAG: hypothetical protein PVI92_03235 [Chromatiales bacterium]|jgi:hypothetical protein